MFDHRCLYTSTVVQLTSYLGIIAPTMLDTVFNSGLQIIALCKYNDIQKKEKRERDGAYLRARSIGCQSDISISPNLEVYLPHLRDL